MDAANPAGAMGSDLCRRLPAVPRSRHVHAADRQFHPAQRARVLTRRERALCQRFPARPHPVFRSDAKRRACQADRSRVRRAPRQRAGRARWYEGRHCGQRLLRRRRRHLDHRPGGQEARPNRAWAPGHYQHRFRRRRLEDALLHQPHTPRFRQRENSRYVGADAEKILSAATHLSLRIMMPLPRRRACSLRIRHGHSVREEFRMLTLYYTPGACSMAAHIVLEESGEKYQPQQVDLAKGEQRTDAYLKIHPLGRVPALRLDDGEPLAENTAILPYLGKRFDLWPSDPKGEAKALSTIGFFAASVHPAHAHVGRPERYTADPSAFPTLKETGLKTFHGYLRQVDDMLAGREWFSEKYSVLDPYGFVVYTRGVPRE